MNTWIKELDYTQCTVIVKCHEMQAMDSLKFILVPSEQVQVLLPVFQVQMDPEGKKKEGLLRERLHAL